MKRLQSKHVMWLALALFAAVIAVVLQFRQAREPHYGGRKFSVLLDELSGLDCLKPVDSNSPQVKAVCAIGTNAIPWLLGELRVKRSIWRLRANHLLNKQNVVEYRFSNNDTRRFRAVVGFLALGDLAAPAIPKLLSMVEEDPIFIPTALAYIGPCAIPALEQCLTNTRAYERPGGKLALIPGNTIGGIQAAVEAGRFSTEETRIFLPAIRRWATQTNHIHAAAHAGVFLHKFWP